MIPLSVLLDMQPSDELVVEEQRLDEVRVVRCFGKQWSTTSKIQLWNPLSNDITMWVIITFATDVMAYIHSPWNTPR